MTTQIQQFNNTGLVSGIEVISPVHYQRRGDWGVQNSITDVGRRTLVPPFILGLIVGSVPMSIKGDPLDINAATNWDSTSPDYTDPANRAGKDFYLYARTNDSGVAQTLIFSANSTVPVGSTATNSRKLGGLHCICVDTGTISGHPLTGFKAGDILPASIWDLHHQPACSPEGMVWSEQGQIWVDIYLQSGTGVSASSIFNGAITGNRTWLDFVDDLAAVGKRPLTDSEFQTIAEGSNQETNIQGSAFPGSTGGHVDTTGRRMVSDIGCEDCCGVIWQWIDEQGYRIESLPSTGDPVFSWYDLPGVKGSMYHQGGQGDVKLRAGGDWSSGSYCGSRTRHTYAARWNAYTFIGSRGCCNPL